MSGILFTIRKWWYLLFDNSGINKLQVCLDIEKLKEEGFTSKTQEALVAYFEDNQPCSFDEYVEWVDEHPDLCYLDHRRG